ncbi:MAG: hypothetical protein J7460_01100 [Chloroflexus sp.]|jgi:hypothetical protein|nr:hypothetical protein [Chloroflexus sp.]MBO9317595.1 hypothetical protein [Chloroflexus sp.]MBO9337307.1 hypothetical protein [Chloroflexus sp.]MBO9371796.1 hypothetical protein [Chloroflexus sp.]
MELQGFLIGLIGWAATAILAIGARRLSAIEQRAVIVCSWLVWMIPGLGTFVRTGILTIDAAALFIGISTVLLAALLLIGVRGRTRAR